MDQAPALMRAAVWKSYGGPDSFVISDLPRPVPKAGEVLIRVRATTVTAGEVEMRTFAFRNILAIPLRLFFGVFRPRGNRVLGQELAGEIVTVGSEVTTFQPGDRVFAQTGFRFGGQAEFACQPASGMVAPIPDSVGYEEAATLPTGGQYALYFTRLVDIRPGMTVLINGGAGSIGSFAIQLAKRRGARVIAVDRGDKGDFMRDLGAEETIDYEKEEFTQRVDAYDLILDVIDKTSYRRAVRSLKPGGTYLHTDLSLTGAIRRKFVKSTGGRSAQMVPGEARQGDLVQLAEMVESGDLRVVIDRTFELDDIVAAHRYADSGEKRGQLVVTVR